MERCGPLKGIKVLEFPAIGPAPFCAMLLADMGADVLRIDRKKSPYLSEKDVTARGKRSIVLDLKDADDKALAMQLIEKADILLEGFRPGVMEKLGFGPEVALQKNPPLIYGRMTGWGQSGPLAQSAGHDINYISLTGALAGIGPKEGPPVPPLNLVGDYGGGALYLAVGVLAALQERNSSGQGQLVDAAIVDGAASLMSVYSWMQAEGMSKIRRGENMLDGSPHYYRCYACADGRYIAVGAIEPHFYAQLWQKLGDLAPAVIPGQDRSEWESGGRILADIFKTKTRDQWNELFAGTDACVSPVMEFDEAAHHPQMRERGTFVEAYGVIQPSPAPRFSRTPSVIQGPPPGAGRGGQQALADWGVITSSSEQNE